MAHLPGPGEDEKYYEMITVSPPPVEFPEYSHSTAGNSKPHYHDQDALGNRISSQEYSQILEQNSSYPAQEHLLSEQQGFSHNIQNNLFDATMFANPNQAIKPDSPDLLSPTSISNGYRNRGTEFLSSQSVYSDAASNANSLFHDAASHFSGAADPPTTLFETQQPHHHQHFPDAFSQEIGLGGSISSTNLADMNYGNQAPFNDSAFGSAFANSDKYYNTEFRASDANDALHLGNDVMSQERWRYDPPNQHDAFSTMQYDSAFNRLTEDNLINYNGKMTDTDAKVTISIHQAPELVAAHTPSLFSNSSHNSSPARKQSYEGVNMLQPPGQTGRSRSPSLSLNPPSPSQSWNSPGLSPNLPSPGGSVYSDVEGDSYLRPEDFSNMRRGRQTAHHLKVRSQSRSHSRSRSKSGSVYSNSEEYYEDESDVDAALGQSQTAGVKSSREKMLELASSATVSKRTQIHPSSYACHLCEKKFTRPYNLKSHLRTHTDDRPFICNICGKAFARQHDRKRHEELHSGEKKYQCRGVLRDGTPFGCGRKFARADALRRHFQTESGRECIKLLVEEDAREQNTDAIISGIQLPDGEFMNPNAPEVPVVSVSPPQEDG